VTIPSTDDPLTAIRSAADLDDLAEWYGVESTHEAYFQAKRDWEAAIAERQQDPADATGVPGRTVFVDDTAFHVHGVTHAGTPEERSFLREHVTQFLNGGASVYCEQGIRSLYFEDVSDVCEMDDYRWAMDECASLDVESHLEELPETGLDALVEDVTPIAAQFRDATFSLIESGSSVYGDRFEQTLGDVAAAFVTDHADLGVGESYEAFALSRTASQDPSRLVALQQYYEREFLPQPLEREWLRAHDPELEIVTHARNERMADYAVYHTDATADVHLLVGAAHQPGVRYYLERYQEDRQLPEPFELF
jgi:hypothetical protein